MGILGTIFGAPGTVEKLTDGIYNGLDKAFYTAEERAEAKKEILNWQLEWMKHTTGQALARRLIALSVVWSWVACVAIALVLGVLSALLESKAAGVAAEYVFKIMSEVMTMPFMLVIGFYFAPHMLGQFGKGK